MGAKKLSIYYKSNHSTINRVKPEKHKLLNDFLFKKWDDISKQYNELTDEEKRKGKVVYYTLQKEGFDLLKSELSLSKKSDSVVLYYRTTRSPFLVINQKKEENVHTDQGRTGENQSK